MDGVAQKAESHRAARGDQVGQVVGLESFEACPESDVRRVWHLRLHRNEVLDLVGGRRLPTLKQMLSREQGTVQRSLTEHGF
jgi:hypothetical protein